MVEKLWRSEWRTFRIAHWSLTLHIRPSLCGERNTLPENLIGTNFGHLKSYTINVSRRRCIANNNNHVNFTKTYQNDFIYSEVSSPEDSASIVVSPLSSRLFECWPTCSGQPFANISWDLVHLSHGGYWARRQPRNTDSTQAIPNLWHSLNYNCIHPTWSFFFSLAWPSLSRPIVLYLLSRDSRLPFPPSLLLPCYVFISKKIASADMGPYPSSLFLSTRRV